MKLNIPKSLERLGYPEGTTLAAAIETAQAERDWNGAIGSDRYKSQGGATAYADSARRLSLLTALADGRQIIDGSGTRFFVE